MAKLRSGILGKSSGKVGNIITASWKGINYAKENVIPSNPKSVKQTELRGYFRHLVLIGKAVKSIFIDTYWENLVRGTANSGFAKFIGTNQKAVYAGKDLTFARLSSGDLEPLSNISIVGDIGSDSVVVTWSDTIVSNGSLTDVVTVYVFDDKRNYLYSQIAACTRASETASCVIPDISTAGELFAFVQCKNVAGSRYSTSQTAKAIV